MPIKHKDEHKRVYKDTMLGDQENLSQLYKDRSNMRKVKRNVQTTKMKVSFLTSKIKKKI
jgi:hypothetical protein